jgi:hypothetical protein
MILIVCLCRTGCKVLEESAHQFILAKVTEKQFQRKNSLWASKDEETNKHGSRVIFFVLTGQQEPAWGQSVYFLEVTCKTTMQIAKIKRKGCMVHMHEDISLLKYRRFEDNSPDYSKFPSLASKWDISNVSDPKKQKDSWIIFALQSMWLKQPKKYQLK